MTNVARRIVGVGAFLFLIIPLRAEETTPLSAQERIQKGQEAGDALAKALEVQG
jgi:hypothetical protein